MCCSGQASCCGGGPKERVSVGVLVYAASGLARMTDEGGGEMCRGDGEGGDGWWVVLVVVVVLFVGQPARERRAARTT
jgi:hypothetical protein